MYHDCDTPDPGLAKDKATADGWMRRASELGHTEATYTLGRDLLTKATAEAEGPQPTTPKTRKGRRKKHRDNTDDEAAGDKGAGGVSFRTSDPSFVEGHALLKKAAAYGHEGATIIVSRLKSLVGKSGEDASQAKKSGDSGSERKDEL